MNIVKDCHTSNLTLVLFLWCLHATLRCMQYCSQASKCPWKRFKPSFFHFYSGYKPNMLKCVLNCRDDDSDDEIDDQDIHKIMIVTQTPPPVKKHDRTGNYVTRVKMTQELSKAINDGLYYYEQVWIKLFFLNGNTVLKCYVIKIKFLKLWDLSGYSERTMSKRPTCQKWAFGGKLSLRL